MQVSERALREIYLPVYQSAVREAEVYVVMGAYNKFRGDYICENDYMLNQVLKNEWGFKGFVVSDWGAVHSTVGSAESGLDVEMGTEGDFNHFFFAQPLLDSLKSGKVTESMIDDKVRRILRVMLNCRIQDPDRSKGSINTPENARVVYQVASESVVLLKNSDAFLPLNMADLKKIAIIGDNAVRKHAAGGFGAGVKARYEISPLQGLQKKLGDRVDILFAQGYQEQYLPGEEGKRKYARIRDDSPDPLLVNEAVAMAKNADAAIIFAGSNRDIESESADRADLQLPFGQVDLIREVASVNPRTIVVLVAGAPFDLVDVNEHAPAIIWSWFNGSEAGTAIADILFGDVNPSGKLPFTVPVRLDDSPAHALGVYPGNDQVNYEEGILVGYRWFDAKNIKPLYPFGHGLSYTQFSYSGLATDRPEYGQEDRIKAIVKIKNTGDRAGKETALLFVQDPDAEVFKPVKELKGFAKVRLEPGEEKEASVYLDARDLAWFNEEKMEWTLDRGEYRILVGSSATDIKGSTSIYIK